MSPGKPPKAPSRAMMDVFMAYESGKLSADEAARQFTTLLRQSDTPVAFSVDRPFREALLRIQIADGKVPPDTLLGSDE